LSRFIRQILLWANIIAAGALFLANMANFISPANIWPIAFFGLAFPILLLINLGFIAFWIWRRKYLTFISIIVLLIGVTNIGRYIQSDIFHKPKTFHNGIKLLSYNVRIFNFYNWEKGSSVREKILNFVIRQKPDILCFQEFLTRENRPGQSKRAIDLKLSQLPYVHVSYSFHGKDFINYGIATYSIYPIVNRGAIKFKNSFNACIYSDLLVKQDTIRVFNVHLESIKLRGNDYNFIDSLVLDFNSSRFIEARNISGRLKQAFIKRAQQVDELNRYIKESPYPVVVCGDFNDTPVSYTYQKVKGNLEDAFMSSGIGIGNTYRGNFPSFRIDYIFHSRQIESSNYETHRINLSDHYPVSCELSFEK
jgi:endonuclease/exonuclease/phosphatase family metal-dependent hydrolase